MRGRRDHRRRHPRAADAVAFPPGAAATSATRSPGCGSRRDHGLTPLVLGRRPSLATAGQPRRVTDAAHDERVGHERAALDLSSPLELGASTSGSARGFGRSVTAAGSFIATSAARASSRRGRGSRATSQSGYESAIASSPAPATAARGG